MKFSGAGWWDHITLEHWESIVTISLIFLGVVSLFVLIWLIVRIFKKDRDRWSRNRRFNQETRTQRLIIKPPLFLLYFIFNTFVHILVMIIGITAGGFVGWLLVLILWSGTHIFFIISQHDDGDEELSGIFHIFGWLDQYTDKIAEFMLYRKKLKEEYKQYLKIEY